MPLTPPKPSAEDIDVTVSLPASVTSTAPWVFDFRSGASYTGAAQATRTPLDPRLVQVPTRLLKCIIYNRGSATYTIRRGGSGGKTNTLGPGQSTLKLSPVTDYLSLTPDADHTPSAGDLDVVFLLPPFGGA